MSHSKVQNFGQDETSNSLVYFQMEFGTSVKKVERLGNFLRNFSKKLYFHSESTVSQEYMV
jgi:hypothetical protein